MQHQLSITSSILVLLAGTSFALPSDRTKPYRIRADKITFDQKQHTSTYINNASICQGTTHLSGQKITLTLNQSNSTIRKLIDIGHPAHFNTLQKSNDKPLMAQADTIIYYPQKQQALLLGHGQIKQDKNIFRGPHIWYDIRNQIVTSTTKKGKGKTTLLIQPQNVQ